jgi:hypothetical protein
MIHEANVGFVDQGRGLQCLARLLLSQLRRCQASQFTVHQR